MSRKAEEVQAWGHGDSTICRTCGEACTSVAPSVQAPTVRLRLLSMKAVFALKVALARHVEQERRRGPTCGSSFSTLFCQEAMAGACTCRCCICTPVRLMTCSAEESRGMPCWRRRLGAH